MNQLKLISNPEVEKVFKSYPVAVRIKMNQLRELVLEAAGEIEGLDKLEEDLRWGEPSYLTKHGSTIRMDWKDKTPDQYAMYFKCTSRLVETFRITFGNTFNFEGKRAIVFKMNDTIPASELKQCIKAGLMYHRVKHLPTLGI